ncbi:hypothetical protein LUZ60_009251 [Juncus effusus]|nr:hypothetical protein LUZ60_009251 [Juncus effusus]
MEPQQPTGAAPPKQVAQAMDRLSRAGRLIAEIRIGADRILEALFIASDSQRHSEKAAELVFGEEAAMRRHFLDLRLIGKQLEESGVLSGALKSRGNSWGLHMPLVCPDGAVVAYAWKRQLAGQAGASAVDRARLALKAFTDQKKRFFPQLDDSTNTPSTKKPKLSPNPPLNPNPNPKPTLSEILKSEMPGVAISTYRRLEWTKRAEKLINCSNEEQRLGNSSERFDDVAIIEVFVSGVFRVLVSLHSAGSVEPDSLAFFSPDEGGSYIHARGVSVHNVFKHITEYAEKALQYFLSVDPNKALSHLLKWVCSYESLLSQVCSKCGKLLAMDKSLALLLPPVHRPYQFYSNGQNQDFVKALHIGCSSHDV